MFKEIFRKVRKEIIYSSKDASVSDFNKEVGQFLEFFDTRKTSEQKKYSSFHLHGSKVSIGATAGNKSTYIERDVLYKAYLPPLKEKFVVEGKKVVKTKISYIDGKIIGNPEREIVSKAELDQVIILLRQITFPYNEYINSKIKYGK
jgi:hypothetical protein